MRRCVEEGVVEFERDLCHALSVGMELTWRLRSRAARRSEVVRGIPAERANTSRRDAEIYQRDRGLSALAC
jgi:hypothetical protein